MDSRESLSVDCSPRTLCDACPLHRRKSRPIGPRGTRAHSSERVPWARLPGPGDRLPWRGRRSGRGTPSKPSWTGRTGSCQCRIGRAGCCVDRAIPATVPARRRDRSDRGVLGAVVQVVVRKRRSLEKVALAVKDRGCVVLREHAASAGHSAGVRYRALLGRARRERGQGRRKRRGSALLGCALPRSWWVRVGELRGGLVPWKAAPRSCARSLAPAAGPNRASGWRSKRRERRGAEGLAPILAN